jgi:hypothetical protein
MLGGGPKRIRRDTLRSDNDADGSFPGHPSGDTLLGRPRRRSSSPYLRSDTTRRRSLMAAQNSVVAGSLGFEMVSRITSFCPRVQRPWPRLPPARLCPRGQRPWLPARPAWLRRPQPQLRPREHRVFRLPRRLSLPWRRLWRLPAYGVPPSAGRKRSWFRPTSRPLPVSPAVRAVSERSDDEREN